MDRALVNVEQASTHANAQSLTGTFSDRPPDTLQHACLLEMRAHEPRADDCTEKC